MTTAPSEQARRALLQRAERPVIVPLSRLINAAAWLAVIAAVAGYALRGITA